MISVRFGAGVLLKSDKEAKDPRDSGVWADPKNF